MKSLYALSVVSLVGWLSLPMVQVPETPNESRAANPEQTYVNTDESSSVGFDEPTSAPAQDGLSLRFSADEANSMITLSLNHFYSSEEKVTMLGVHVRSPDGTLRRHLKIKPGLGLVVEQVVPGSAAEQAGISVDDVLLRFGDQWLVNESQLTTLVRNSSVGEQVALSIIREGSPQTIEVALREGTAAATGKWIDLELHPALSDSLLQHLTDAKFQNCAACHTGVGEYHLVPVLRDSISSVHELQFVWPERNAALNGDK